MEFKPGDVVRLKSGGPKMTIVRFDTENERYFCTWFDENTNRHSELFEAEILKSYDDESLVIQMV